MPSSVKSTLSKERAGVGVPVDLIPFGVTLDGAGRVVGTSGLSAEASSCVLAALDGLVFPCLAGASLCETVLVE